MITSYGEKVTKIVGYSASIISLIGFFTLIYLGLYRNLSIKIEDIVICLLSSIIFFVSAKIKKKKD